MSRRPGRPAVEVFALEPRAAQLVVRAADDGLRVVTLDGRDAVVETASGVGAVVFDGLEPDTSYEARLDGRPAVTLRTLAE
ncbi:MAG TPA: hypothetical protein VF076_07280, partial [Acidimicrobiales bacterium]